MPYTQGWKQFFRDLKNEIAKDRVSNGAAALAYYLMLAIFPAMIALLSVIPYLPIPNLDKAIMDLLLDVMPGDAAQMFMGVVNEVILVKRGGLLSLGLLGALWAASNGTYAMMQQMNVTYGTQETRSFIQVRAIAVGLTLLLGVMVITAFSIILLGEVIQGGLDRTFGWGEILGLIFFTVRWCIVLLALLISFSIIYYFGPNVKHRFRVITPGGVLGTFILVVISLGFKAYVTGFGNYSATYGGIGAVIVLMLWLYLSGIALLLGSEANALIESAQQEGNVSQIAKHRSKSA